MSQGKDNWIDSSQYRDKIIFDAKNMTKVLFNKY